MELVNRYLQAVKFWLPRSRRDDILAELSEDLHAQIEERSLQLGREPSREEIAQILRRCGHPIGVGARYRASRPLVGEELQPVYYFILKLVLLWVLAPVFALVIGPVVIATSAHRVLAVIQVVWGYATAVVFAGGIITMIFALIQRFGPKDALDPSWNPLRLPRVQRAWSAPPSRLMATLEIVASFIWSVSWIFVLSRASSFDAGGVHIVLAPIWRAMFWPILAIFLCGVAPAALSLLRPPLIVWRVRLRLAIDAATVAVIGILLTAGSWVEISGAAAAGNTMRWANTGVALALLVVAVIVSVDAAQEASRLRQARVAMAAH